MNYLLSCQLLLFSLFCLSFERFVLYQGCLKYIGLILLVNWIIYMWSDLQIGRAHKNLASLEKNWGLKMRLKFEWRTPGWRLRPGADFRSLSRHDWIIKGWSLDKMFTRLGKPSVFTLANWSPFILSCPLGDQHPLNSSLWQSCFVHCLHPEIAWFSWLFIPLDFPCCIWIQWQILTQKSSWDFT